MADINAVAAANPVNANDRRTRNRSKRQSAHSSGAATNPATINCICNRGNTESRNENVSRSMIRKSRNVSVNCRIPNLKRDSAIKSTMKASASAAQIPVRGSTDSNRQFTDTHASSDIAIANGPYSVVKRTTSSVRSTATTAPANVKYRL